MTWPGTYPCRTKKCTQVYLTVACVADELPRFSSSSAQAYLTVVEFLLMYSAAILMISTIFFFYLDVDECSPVSDCMHICENTMGGYNCKCNSDFKVDETDSKKCVRKYSLVN